MTTHSKPVFEKTRNLAFSIRKKLSQVFLGQLLEIRANTRPDFPVLTFENNQDPDFVQTFQDLHENSHRFARALLEAGLTKGDKYAAIMYNYPEMIHLFTAGSIIGAIVVPIDPRTKGDKIFPRAGSQSRSARGKRGHERRRPHLSRRSFPLGPEGSRATDPSREA